MFGRVAVVGLGILGGSLCRSIRAAAPEAKLFGYDLDRSAMEKAVAQKILDGFFSPDDNLSEFECVAVALPVQTSIDFLALMMEKSGDGCIIIDTGSVKAPVVDALRNRPGFSKFVPCHPMAGSDRSGYDNSTEVLFRDATVILTPHDENLPEAVSAVEAFWTELGSRVVLCDPAEHDKTVAKTSHLPHLLSVLLAIEAASAGKGIRPFCGKGIADMTRLAGGSPAVWADISIMNADNILDAINEYSCLLEDVRTSLSSGDGAIRQFLEKGVRSKKELFDEEDNRSS